MAGFRIERVVWQSARQLADEAEKVAGWTREAFGVPGRFAGALPAPDGVGESARAVLEDVARGAIIWVARARSGTVAGVVRAIPAGEGCWELKRLGVCPSFRGQGLGAALVRAVEQEAVRAGIRQLTLRCSVERLLPPFYANLGYRVVALQAHPSKPTTVATMQRMAVPTIQRGAKAGGTPDRGTPWDRLGVCRGVLPQGGVYVVWLWLGRERRLPVPSPAGVRVKPGLYAYVGSAQRSLPGRLRRHLYGSRRLRWHMDHLRRYARPVGVDVWADAGRPDECRLARALAEQAEVFCNAEPDGHGPIVPGFGASDCSCPAHLVRFGVRPQEVQAFVSPRRAQPQLVCAVRLPAGEEDFAGHRRRG